MCPCIRAVTVSRVMSLFRVHFHFVWVIISNSPCPFRFCAYPNAQINRSFIRRSSSSQCSRRISWSVVMKLFWVIFIYCVKRFHHNFASCMPRLPNVSNVVFFGEPSHSLQVFFLLGSLRSMSLFFFCCSRFIRLTLLRHVLLVEYE